MAICPACSFKDFLNVLDVYATVPARGDEEERKVTLHLAVCGTCGNVFCSDWKEFFLENFSGKIIRNSDKLKKKGGED